MSFQEIVSKTIHTVLNNPEYKEPIGELTRRIEANKEQLDVEKSTEKNEGFEH